MVEIFQKMWWCGKFCNFLYEQNIRKKKIQLPQNNSNQKTKKRKKQFSLKSFQLKLWNQFRQKQRYLIQSPNLYAYLYLYLNFVASKFKLFSFYCWVCCGYLVLVAKTLHLFILVWFISFRILPSYLMKCHSGHWL